MRCGRLVVRRNVWMRRLSCATLFLTCALLVGTSRGDQCTRVTLSETRDTSTEYFVVFCARKSLPHGPGHSFVVWVKQEAGSRPVGSGYGFYPTADRVVWHLFTGIGKVSDESQRAASIRRHLLTHRLVVRVDQETYEASQEARRTWRRGRPGYRIFSRNCTHFTHAISRSVFPEAPEPRYGERPPTYLQRLASFAEKATAGTRRQPSLAAPMPATRR